MRKRRKFKIGDIVGMKDEAYYIIQRSEWGSKTAQIVSLEDYEDEKDTIWYGIETPNGYINSYPECDLFDARPNNNKDAKHFLSSHY